MRSPLSIMFAFAIIVACSNNAPPVFDAGACDGGATPGALASFTPPADPGAGGIIFAASGEALALTGYPFPPVNTGDPCFVDGWDVAFSRVLVTVDRLKLWSNPDLSPGDPSKTGAQVAEVDGPWAIDLSHSDPTYLPGKGGGGEEAVPFAALAGGPFSTDGTRYAFGFDLIAATSQTCGRATMNVNIDDAGLADYQTMIQNQCVVYYDGIATFKGTENDPTCNADPVYATWPKTIHFQLCFRSPASYINCQNPDNDPAAPLAGEEHERGIAFLGNQSVIGQVTVHTDHPFWDSVLHDSPAHFDQFAARVAGQGDASSPVATLDLTKGVDYTQYADALGDALHWRYCIDPPTDVHTKFSGAMAFDSESIPHAIGGDPATGFRDYEDYSTYNQSTQGHLNSDGLCYVRRNYASPY